MGSYFSNLALQEMTAMRMHVDEGLWQRTPEGSRDWGNVSEHCLAEVARADVLCDLTGVSANVKRDSRTGAAVHDVGKKTEKELMASMGMTPEAFSLAGDQLAEKLVANGFSPRVVRLAGAAGHDKVPETDRILSRPDPLPEEDIAYLINHTIDDYTMGSDWAQPAETLEDGRQINDIDRRMDAASINPRYQLLREHTLTNADGTPYNNGEGAYDAQRRVGHANQARLAQIIAAHTGAIIDPLDLPVYVDNIIKQRIQNQ